MSRSMKVVVTSDLSGEVIAEDQVVAVKLADPITGEAYELDLSTPEAQALQATLRRYFDAGRPVAQTKRNITRATRTARSHRRPAEQVKAIRDWAAKNGYEISARGRIPGEIEDAYNAAGATA